MCTLAKHSANGNTRTRVALDDVHAGADHLLREGGVGGQEVLDVALRVVALDVLVARVAQQDVRVERRVHHHAHAHDLAEQAEREQNRT